MKPEENSRNVESEADEPTEVETSEVFSADVVEENTSNPEVELVEAETVPQGESVAMEFQQAANDSVLVGAAGEGLWQGQEVYQKPRAPKLPSLIEIKVARICFAVAIGASFLFMLWFCVRETNVKQNSLVVIRYMLPIAFVMFLDIAGLIRIRSHYVPSDSRWIGWVSAFIACACLFFVLPLRWRWVCLIWSLFQLAPIVGNFIAPQKPEEENYNLNDSVAANGGAIASIFLGSWAIFGSLFTMLSMVNSVFGMLLGVWGLSSRKKGLAILGIALCLVGGLASLLPFAEFFWEIMSAQEDELMQPGF